MAHRRSSLKKIRVDKKRHAHNVAVTSALRTKLRKAHALLAEKKSTEVVASASELFSEVDKAVKRGILHKNNASRKKSRFMRRLNALKASK